MLKNAFAHHYRHWFAVLGLMVLATLPCKGSANAMGLEDLRAAKSLPDSTPATLPYFCDFEDSAASAEWSFADVSGSNHWFIGNAVGCPGRSLFISNNNGESNAYSTGSITVQIAYIPVSLPTDSSYAVSYDWRSNGESGCDFMRVALIPESYDMTTAPNFFVSYLGTLPTGWIALDGGAMCNRNTWKHATYGASAQAGTYRLAVIWVNDGSGGLQSPGAIDNIGLRIITCPTPTGLRAFSNQSTSADISWTSTASRWVVEYGPTGFTRGQGTIDSANSTTHTITGLQAATNYDVYVRAICGADDESIDAKTTVTTSCYDGGFQDWPYTESFENGFACWTQTPLRGNVRWSTQNSINNQPAPEGMRFAMFEEESYDSCSTLLASPILNLSGYDSTMMEFSHIQPAWGNDQDKLELVYRVHPDSSWHRIYEWTNNISTWVTEYLWLPRNSSMYQIGFIATSGYARGVGVDNITIYGSTNSPTCDMPSFVRSVVEENLVEVEWVADGSNYVVGIKNTTSGNWTDVSTTAASHTFTGLEAGTRYSIRLRRICGNGMSAWAKTAVKTLDAGEEPECSAPTNLELRSGNYNTATASFSWEPGGDESEWEVSIDYQGGEPEFHRTDVPSITIGSLHTNTEYEIQVRSICSESSVSRWSDKVSFNLNNPGQGINDAALGIVKIYPNPSNGIVTIATDGIEGGVRIVVTDICGREIRNIHTYDKNYIINGLKSGCYFVKATSDNGISHTSKLIVK